MSTRFTRPREHRAHALPWASGRTVFHLAPRRSDPASTALPGEAESGDQRVDPASGPFRRAEGRGGILDDRFSPRDPGGAAWRVFVRRGRSTSGCADLGERWRGSRRRSTSAASHRVIAFLEGTVEKPFSRDDRGGQSALTIPGLDTVVIYAGLRNVVTGATCSTGCTRRQELLKAGGARRVRRRGGDLSDRRRLRRGFGHPRVPARVTRSAWRSPAPRSASMPATRPAGAARPHRVPAGGGAPHDAGLVAPGASPTTP